jgi:epoxyqueuosine reductase
MSSPHELAERCLAALVEAGAAAVGVGDVQPLDAAQSVIESRRDAGLHAGMQFTYRNPARSCDPRSALPSARSLVVAAIPYRSEQTPRPSEPVAAVARYAAEPTRTRMHQVLDAAAEVLRGDGWRAVVVADDNALVDRAVANRVGIGWFGHNTNILVPGIGSWVVLGSVLTDAELAAPPATPMAERCGACRRCIEACPTDALVEPGVLDANRCLSWLLQTQGEFPEAHRESLGLRIYGCDECQSACPVNRNAPVVEASGDGPGDWVDLEWLLSATDDDLLRELGDWYIPRRDARFVRRNALVVLGNTRGELPSSIVQHLRRWLTCDEPLLVEHAAWAARRHGIEAPVGATAVAEARHPGDN